MSHFPLVALLLFGCSAVAQTDARLLVALGQVESGGNRRAVGDHGAALGRYQLHASSWHDANAQLARERLRTIPAPIGARPPLRTSLQWPSSAIYAVVLFLSAFRTRQRLKWPPLGTSALRPPAVVAFLRPTTPSA